MKTVSSKDIRNKRMQYIDVMDDIKVLPLLPRLDVATLQMVADYFGLEKTVVYNYSNTHRKELEDYGIVKLRSKDFENAGYDIETIYRMHIARLDDVEVNIYGSGLCCMSKAAVFNMALGIANSEVADKIKAAAALAETESHAPSEESETDTSNNMENMAADILTFTNTEFGTIRLVEIDGQPWFVGKDVAESLGYTNTKKALADHVEAEDKLQGDGVTIRDPMGRKQNPTVINESGLYSLIMSSKLPTAKQFKRWVTSEVLPSVRKNGGYIAEQEALTETELMAKALLVAQKALEDREKRIAELSVCNKAMTENINTWDKKSVINALIRTYGGRCFNGDFKAAFADFYRQFNYKYGTNLKARRTRSGDNKSLIDYMTETEKGNALKLAVAICESREINTGAIINQVNAAAYGT